MLSFLLFCIFMAQLALAQNNPPAPVITSNVQGSGYTVTINSGPGSIMGSFSFITATDQHIIQVSASLNGFNVTDDNTYIYHIHQQPVPANGSCNATGEHLDPYHAGATYQCDPTNPSLCQVGDLSGKHGAIQFNGTVGTGSYSFTYYDDFLSTNMSDPAFFGNLSVVIHRKRDGLRLNCGNMVAIQSSPANSSGVTYGGSDPNGSATSNSPATSYATMTAAYPTTSTSPSQSTTTTVAFPTSAHSTVSATSSFTSTPTGIQSGGAWKYSTVPTVLSIFQLMIVAAVLR